MDGWVNLDMKSVFTDNRCANSCFWSSFQPLVLKNCFPPVGYLRSKMSITRTISHENLYNTSVFNKKYEIMIMISCKPTQTTKNSIFPKSSKSKPTYMYLTLPPIHLDKVPTYTKHEPYPILPKSICKWYK